MGADRRIRLDYWIALVASSNFSVLPTADLEIARARIENTERLRLSYYGELPWYWAFQWSGGENTVVPGRKKGVKNRRSCVDSSKKGYVSTWLSSLAEQKIENSVTFGFVKGGSHK